MTMACCRFIFRYFKLLTSIVLEVLPLVRQSQPEEIYVTSHIHHSLDRSDMSDGSDRRHSSVAPHRLPDGEAFRVDSIISTGVASQPNHSHNEHQSKLSSSALSQSRVSSRPLHPSQAVIEQEVTADAAIESVAPTAGADSIYQSVDSMQVTLILEQEVTADAEIESVAPTAGADSINQSVDSMQVTPAITAIAARTTSDANIVLDRDYNREELDILHEILDMEIENVRILQGEIR